MVVRMNKERLKQIGIIRLCSDCSFETDNRTDMKIHQRRFNHLQKEIKK